MPSHQAPFLVEELAQALERFDGLLDRIGILLDRLNVERVTRKVLAEAGKFSVGEIVHYGLEARRDFVFGLLVLVIVDPLLTFIARRTLDIGVLDSAPIADDVAGHRTRLIFLGTESAGEND